MWQVLIITITCLSRGGKWTECEIFLVSRLNKLSLGLNPKALVTDHMTRPLDQLVPSHPTAVQWGPIQATLRL